jgi:hypothetical protein
MLDHAPAGALVPPDAVSARKARDALRRATLDHVRADIRGVGFRFDQIVADFRGPADRMERADPKHTVIRYGPLGLYQCEVTITGADSSVVSAKMAFARTEEPKPGWELTLRASLYDLVVTISIARDSDETEIGWHLSPKQGSAQERLTSLRFYSALNHPGTMTITSIEPDYGIKEYDLTGDGVDADITFGLTFWAAVVAVEEHIGAELPLPETADRDFLKTLFIISTALTTRVANIAQGPGWTRVALAEGVEPVKVGADLTVELDERVFDTLCGIDIDIGTARYSVLMRVTQVEIEEPGVVLYYVVPITDDAIEAVILSDEELAHEMNEAMHGQAAGTSGESARKPTCRGPAG